MKLNIYVILGWSYEEVLPFFKISEDNRDPKIARNTRFQFT